MRSSLHARNRHREGYDLSRLAAAYAPLAPHVIEGGSRGGGLTVDFRDASAVAALNAALLCVDYRVEGFAVPENNLVPAVPGLVERFDIEPFQDFSAK